MGRTSLYLLTSAHAVKARARTGGESPRGFGGVVEPRLGGGVGITMRRKTITLIVTLVLGAVGLTIAGQASAEQALSVSGTYTVGLILAPQLVRKSVPPASCFAVTRRASQLRTSAISPARLLPTSPNSSTARPVGQRAPEPRRSLARSMELLALGRSPGSTSSHRISIAPCPFFFPFNFDINSVACEGSGCLRGLAGQAHVHRYDL